MRLSARIVPILLLSVLSTAWAASVDRIATTIDNNQTAELKGTVHPKAEAIFDRGPVEPTLKLEYITLQVSPSPSQQAALDRLLADQQDSASPSYLRWLTPEQFADRFGMSRSDTSKITNWLLSNGFTIVQVARARNWVAFSGTASQVQSALHTQIHRFDVDGEQHYANVTNVSLPKALVGVVTNIRGLNDFLWRSMVARRMSPQSSGLDPFYSNGGGNFLAPDDIATIYNIKPLYTAGIDGTNTNLVIVGQTDITLSDITQFRSGFNLPAIKLQQTLATGCADPGTTGDLVEADLDVEWSGAVARNANMIFVRCDAGHGGVFTAAQYAIDNKLAPVISMSYGGCEPLNGSSSALQIRAIIQQANSSGITFISSSGDTGAAGCDAGKAPPATGGLEVNLPASVPETTALGGSEFNEGSGTYWGSNGPNFGSALSYIPEEGWNDTALGNGFASTGGGKSIYFGKPVWQSGSDGARDVPDVTIAASADHDGYLLCSSGSCAGGIVNDHSIVGGTSASAPVFAGIVTLLNQYLLKNGVLTQPGLANINPTLYQLSSSNPSAFHDITTGNNIVPCTPGTPPGYPVSQQCPAGGQFGYSAGSGFDLVTGLGSVDAYNLVTGWSNSGSPTTTVLTSPTASPVIFGASTTFKATVSPAPAVTSPPQTVQFFATNPSTGRKSLGTAPLNSAGVATLTITNLPGGNNSVTAAYGGDFAFGASTSAILPFAVEDFTIAANPTTITISSPGQSGTSTITVTPQAGFNQAVTFSCPSGLPSEATCTFNPTSVTPNGSTAITTTLTVQTTAASALLDHRFGPNNLFFAMLIPGLLGLVVSTVGRKQTSRGVRLLSLIAMLAFSTLWLPACGGGSSSGPPSNPGTPAGTSPNVMVSATTGGSTPLVNPVAVTVVVQ